MFIQIQNFPQDLPDFKHGKKNKLSKYFRLFFWVSHFLEKKRSSQWISPKMLQNTERHSLAVCGSLCVEETENPILLFDQKQLFKQIFSSIFLFKHFLSISLRLDQKKKISLWILPKNASKTTERHSLAVCGSLCGENQFLLIFIPFYWFD